MSTSKATPGPWKAQKNHTTWDIFGRDGWPICSVYTDPGREDANARLIAAAPALRDALRRQTDAHYETIESEFGSGAADNHEDIIAARALLARLDAEGK